MSISLIIYIIGCIFANIICIIEAYKHRNENQDDIGMSSILIISSWFTVIMYLYGIINSKK